MALYAVDDRCLSIDQIYLFVDDRQMKLNSRKGTFRYTATQKKSQLAATSTKSILNTVVASRDKNLSLFLNKRLGRSVPK